MRSSRIAKCTLAAAAILLMAAPAHATTLIRQSVERLARENSTALVGRVVSAHSYWNADHSMILTDVRLRTTDLLKGRPGLIETVTLMGGTVGDVTTLIVAGPELIPGSDYLLFVNDEELPGGVLRPTVRDLAQGVFRLRSVGGRLRAWSQAIGHPLLPDADGLIEPAGGYEGINLDELTAQVRAALE
jgi:hypothetical protein